MNIQTGVKMMVRLNKAATVDIYEAEARTAQWLQCLRSHERPRQTTYIRRWGPRPVCARVQAA